MQHILHNEYYGTDQARKQVQLWGTWNLPFVICFPVTRYSHILPASISFPPPQVALLVYFSARLGLVLRALTGVPWFPFPPVASKPQLLFLLYSQLSLPTSYVFASITTHNRCSMSVICIVLPPANSRREELPSVHPLCLPIQQWALLDTKGEQSSATLSMQDYQLLP